jgi:D-alanine transaminase
MSEQTTNIYLNGQFMPLAEATIPVLDRGFLFGDSVYEVIPAYGGNLFRLEQHLQRLEGSLEAIRMRNPLPFKQWRNIMEQLLEQRPNQDQSIYLQVTRGATTGRDHAIPEGLEPTVFIMASPIPEVDPKLATEGIKAVSLDDIRWHRCNIKATALLANVLLKQRAADEQADEAILIRNGRATEGSASNLFMIRDNLLITPPKSRFLLPGITRDLVLELARDNGINSEEREIDTTELESADEIWLTSSTKEIMPVTSLDGRAVGSGRPGPLFHQLSRLYSAMKERAGQE